MRLSGSITALLTPFKGDDVDEQALKRQVRFQLKNGTSGLVPCGSTGEAATLNHDEYVQVIRLVVREAAGRVPVIAGVGANDTKKAVHLCRDAAAAGADALLVLVPYYNKPTQEGIFRHFQETARATNLPIVAYNIPGRTGVNMAPATLARIADRCRNVVAVKEASGSLDQVSETFQLAPKGFTVLSGDDSLTVPMMSLGAAGVISVLSNVLPRETSRVVAAARNGDFKTAARLHLTLFPVIKALFVETNPIPVKAAAAMKGFGSGIPRLPLTPATPSTRQALKAAFKKAGFRL